jgi:hypothetical protein
MKIVWMALTAALVLSMTGCGTTGGSTSEAAAKPGTKPLGGVPDFVNEVWMNASEDVLIGLGTYKVGDVSNISRGKPFAETRARADITRQLTSIIKDMITDYTAASELDPDAALGFQENVTQALAKAELKGSKVVRMEVVDGVLWIVMEYSRSAAAKDYDAATAAAKLAVPAAAAFDALSRMDTAFSKASGGGPSAAD